MDKKFGSPWHVIVGKAFAYEITYEVRRGQPRQQSGNVACGRCYASEQRLFTAARHLNA